MYWSFFGVLIALVVPSIICGFYVYFRTEFTGTRPVLPLYLTAFDVESNWNSLASVAQHPKAITSIDGIRVLSMMLVVFGHQFSVSLEYGIGTWRNVVDVVERVLDYDMIIVPADLSVDSFFVMGGLVTAYVAQNKADKFFNFSSGRFGYGLYLDAKGAIAYLLFYLNRWMRLTPMMALMIWFANNVALDNGPGPGTGRYPSDGCQEEWWMALLYVQGWLNKLSCQGQIWYLQCEFWFYLAFPLLAAFYANNKTSGVILTLCFISLSCIHNGLASYVSDAQLLHNWKMGQWSHGVYDGNGTYISSKPPNYQRHPWHDFYFHPYARFHSYGVGILCGWFLKAVKQTPRLTKLQVIVAWSMCFAALFSGWYAMVVFFEPESINDGIYDWSNGTAYDFDSVIISTRIGKPFLVLHLFIKLKKGTAFWNSTTRTMWSIGVGLLIVICHAGGGFIINTFLSCNIFTILAKLTYIVYLIHIPLIMMWMTYMHGFLVFTQILNVSIDNKPSCKRSSTVLYTDSHGNVLLVTSVLHICLCGAGPCFH